ncbi:MAG: M20/M25/M40 family metallo-hydrolase, partial [Acidobacteria bacterium]|nr:M20/M25/M40 family metallo-hydrolase [Acidobacteriota bacterium]
LLREFGAEAEAIPTAGNPVVVGRLGTDPRRPTVAVYNHLDVQPAERSEWGRDPFVFAREGDRYLGRGATDDKGPALTALFAARFAAENGVPLNFHFFWELEEEIGSPNFASFLRGHRRGLRVDSVLVSDTIWIARGKPAVPYGLRGLQPATLTLETGARDVHSGLTGGAARNPIGELAALLAECHDAKTGRVKIPRFYDDVVRPMAKEVRSFLGSGFTTSSFQAAHGLKTLRTRDRARLLRAIWAEPTFEVHGIVGGYAGPGVKTVVPQRAEAKVSMRLVPRQRAARAFRLLEEFVRRRNPDVRVLPQAGLEPYLGDLGGPYAEAARAALRFGFGRAPAFVREGGSIGAVVTMRDLLRVPITLIGLSLPEHGYHAPNEYFDWGQAAGGMKTFVRYFSEISRS